MRFVHAPGEHRLTPGGPKVTVQPQRFGHPTMSFRGHPYDLEQEGSRVVLDLPDQPPMPDGSRSPITPAEIDSLAAHGFIAEGIVATDMVEDAVQAEVGTTDLKAALAHAQTVQSGQTDPPPAPQPAPPKKAPAATKDSSAKDPAATAD